MLTRFALGAFAALLLTAPVASAQDVVPLAGKGENIQPIARVNVPRANEVELAGDWAFVSHGRRRGRRGRADDRQHRRSDQAVHRRAAGPPRWAGCATAATATSTSRRTATRRCITNAHCGTCAEGEVAWVAILDVTDKSKPKLARQDHRRRHDGLRPHGHPGQQRRSTSTRRSRPSTRRRATRTSRSSTSPTRPARSRRARSQPTAPRSASPTTATSTTARTARRCSTPRRSTSPTSSTSATRWHRRSCRAAIVELHDLARRAAQPRPLAADRRRRGRRSAASSTRTSRSAARSAPVRPSVDSGSVHFYAAAPRRHVRQRRRAAPRVVQRADRTSRRARASRTSSGRRPTRTA